MAGTYIDYLDGTDTCEAYVALPATSGPHPAVLVAHQWSGQSDHERATADKIAAAAASRPTSGLVTRRFKSADCSSAFRVVSTVSMPLAVAREVAQRGCEVPCEASLNSAGIRHGKRLHRQVESVWQHSINSGCCIGMARARHRHCCDARRLAADCSSAFFATVASF
jgi:hypothetical protein